MELFEDPEFLNAQKSIKELVRVRSIKEASKIIVKASPTKFFLIFLIFILPLSLFQLLFEANTRFVVALFTWDLYHKSSPEYLLSDQKLVSKSIYDCIYLVLFSTFYLLSITAITILIPSLYLSRPLSFMSVVSTIPRIFKRLAITLFHVFPLIFLIYTAYLAVFVLICTLLITVVQKVQETDYVLVSLLIIAIVFLSIIDVSILVARAHAIASWSCANIVSILEPNTYGSTAIKRSKLLLQEKEESIKNILVLLHLVTDIFIWIVFLVMPYDMNTGRVLIISFCVLAPAAGNFLGLIAQNLMYYVCTGFDNQVTGKGVCDDCEFGKDDRVEGDKLEV